MEKQMIQVQPHCEYYLCNFPTGECQGMCQKTVENDDDIQDYKKPWVGLTDAEQQELYDAWIKIGDGWGSFYALIEAKLKEKNT
jgi:hypothetical protein